MTYLEACLGEMEVEFLTRLFNTVESERMPEERGRRSVWVLISKNKGVRQSWSYRGVKFIINSMKLRERVAEAKFRREVIISEQRCDFMPGKESII